MGHPFPRMSFIFTAGSLVGLSLVSNCNVQGRFIGAHCMIPNVNGVAGDDACRNGEGYCTLGSINVGILGMEECNLAQRADERGCVYDTDDKAELDEIGVCRFECGISAEALACNRDGTVADDVGLDCLKNLYIGDPDDDADDGDGLRSTECFEGATTGSVCDPACDEDAPFCHEIDRTCTNDCSVVGDGGADANVACESVDPFRPFCIGRNCAECVGNGDCDASNREQCIENECVDPCGNACEGDTPICRLEGNSGMCVECTGSDTSACSVDAPFCNAGTNTCVNCGGLPASVDADMACAGLNSDTPVCHVESCVQCSELNNAACGGTTPVCDIEDGVCRACDGHEQCGEAACNLFTGACLPTNDEIEGAVVTVGPGQQFDRLEDAIGSFTDPEAQGTIVVHGGGSYDEAGTVGGARVVAFLANDGDLPRWTRVGGGDSPQLTIEGATVLIDGIRISGNGSTTDPAILVDGGRAWVERGRIVQNSGGGIVVQNSGELVVRSSFVGVGNSDGNTLEIDGASAEVLYSTVGIGAGIFAEVFPVLCSGDATISIRNSLLVSVDGEGGAEVSCSAATVTNTASETLIAGRGNVALGEVGADWFLDFYGGDYHLENPPPMLATVAVWEDGDPPTDIDGDPRPDTDGTADYAGADVP